MKTDKNNVWINQFAIPVGSAYAAGLEKFTGTK
jgi:hypothetical protein